MSDSRTVKTVNPKMVRRYDQDLLGRHHPHGREPAFSPGKSSVNSSASASADRFQRTTQ